jgi:cytochrome c551/c552
MHTVHPIFRAVLVVVILSAGWSAQASEALADKNACLNCHGVNNKMVGPAFSAIAAKYKDRNDAGAYLTEKIAKGSTGVWGQIPMPAMPQVAAEDAKAIASWIMALPAKN